MNDHYSYDRRGHTVVAANVFYEIAKSLDDQFSSLLKSGDADGLVREEAKMVREFKAGIQALKERLGLIKKSTAYAPSLPDAAMVLVWTTSQKEASAAVQAAIRNYEEAIQTATISALTAERWFSEKILALDPKRPLFNWPAF